MIKKYEFTNVLVPETKIDGENPSTTLEQNAAQIIMKLRNIVLFPRLIFIT